MQLDQLGINMLCELEGYRSIAYLDSLGVWTIGFGTTILPNGKKVTISTPRVTPEIAMQYIQVYLNDIYTWITSHCKWQMTQGNFNCITSFLYNMGLGEHLNKCPLTKQAIINGNKKEIIAQLLNDTSGGLLLNRRKTEIAMFNS